MSTAAVTINVGTTATHLVPSSSDDAAHSTWTIGGVDAVGSFEAPGAIYVGGPDVTTATGALLGAGDKFSWAPGIEDIWAVAAAPTDVDVLFTGVGRNAADPPTPPVNAAPALNEAPAYP